MKLLSRCDEIDGGDLPRIVRGREKKPFSGLGKAEHEDLVG